MWAWVPTHQKQGDTNIAASWDASPEAEQTFWEERFEVSQELRARRYWNPLVSKRCKDGLQFCICSKLCSLLSRAKPGELLPQSPGEKSLRCAERWEREHPIRWLSHLQTPAPLPLGECVRVQEKEERQEAGWPWLWGGGRILLALHMLSKTSLLKSICFNYCLVLTRVSMSKYSGMKQLCFSHQGLILQQEEWIYPSNRKYIWALK